MKSLEQIALEVAKNFQYEEMDDEFVTLIKVIHEKWLAQQTPVAHVYLHDIQQSRELGTCAPAYPISVGTAFDKSVPVFLAPAIPEGTEYLGHYATDGELVCADKQTVLPDGWQPISTAPTDGTEIIGFCNHDADEYSLNEGKTLTNYACACEAYGHVEDGQHVVYWERETTDGSWEEGYYTLPGYWAAKGSDGECCANPTHWQPLPPPPGEKK